MICTDPFSTYAPLVAIGSIFSIIISSLVYMAGKFTDNPRIIATARDSMVGVISTTIIMGLIVLLISLMCNLNIDDFVGFVQAFDPDPTVYTDMQNTHVTIYSYSFYYLDWAKKVAYNDVLYYKNQIRNAIDQSSRNKWECQMLCIIGGGGISSMPGMGYQYMIGIYSMLLNIATTGLLVIMSYIKFFVFVYVGLVDFLVPIAIILRTLPGTKSYGSSLLSVFIVLYLMFPMLLVFNALVWRPIVSVLSTTVPIGSCSSAAPGTGFTGTMVTVAQNNPIFISGLSFMTTVFIPALNTVLMVAAVRSLGRLVDEDIFTGKIFQMM